MSNILLTPSMITKEAVRLLSNNLGFTKGLNRQYDSEFAKSGAKIGSTINIRKPPRFNVVSGPALQIQDAQEQYVPLTLSSQKHVDFQFSSKDLTLSVDEFKDRFLKPAINALANQIDYDGLAQIPTGVWNTVGAPGTTPSAALTWLQAGQKLDENAAPRDDMRSAIMNPAAQASTVDALKGLFQSGEKIAEQYESGMMGKGLGYTWRMDQNINSYTVGAQGGTPTSQTSGGAQTGSSIATAGWTASVSGVVKAGDVITFAGVFAVNPVNFQNTGSLKQFVVQAAASSNGSGVATLSILPAVVTSGPYQNVTQSIPQSAALTVLGSANTVSPCNLVYHRDAMVLGMADLELPQGVDFAAKAADPQNGLSLRIVRAYDVVNDIFPCRIDALYGYALIYPEWMCRIQG